MTTARSYTDDLVDILDGLVKIEPLIEGMTLDRFVQNEKTVSAVVRAMESIEESPKRIPIRSEGALSGGAVAGDGWDARLTDSR